MKQYKSPKITIIELSSGQAVLQVCQVGGNYIDGSTRCVGAVTTFGPGWCMQTVRGIPTGASAGFIRHDMPS